MDWREGRDDRQTERERNETRWDWQNEDRDWQREDRQFTLSERERVARERQEARARNAATRAQAEARRQADLAAWGRTADAMSAPPASARAPVSIAPPDMAPGAMSPPSRAASNSVSIMPTPAPAESIPAPVETGERPAVPRQRANRDQKLGPRIEDDEPAPTDESLRRDTDRRAVSIAAAESTAPQPASAPVSISSDADIDRIAAGLSAAPQPSPRDRSAEMLAAQETIQPRPGAPTAPEERVPDAYDRRAESVWGAVRDGAGRAGRAAVSILEGAAERMGGTMLRDSASQMDTAGTIASGVGMTGAGARAYRTAEDLRRVADRPGQTRGRPMTEVDMPPQEQPEPPPPLTPGEEAARRNPTGQTYGVPMVEPRMPPSAATPSPRPQAAPEASTAPAPAQQAAQAPAGVRRDVAQIAQATPRQMPQTAEGTPTASMQAVAAETVAAARSGQGNTPRAREQVAERFVETYRRNTLPPIVDHFIRTGRISEASQAMEFFDQLEVRAGMQSWARAIHAYSLNDTEGMLDGLLEAYNNESYYPDGLSAVRSGTRMVTNEDGEVIGADITLRDNATGREFTQQIRGLDDMIAVGIGTLSPEAAFEHYLEASGARRAARRQNIEPTQMRQIEDAAYERASQGGLRQPTPEEVQSEMQAILSRMGVSASGMGARAAIPVLP